MLLGNRYLRQLDDAHARVREAIAAHDTVMELTGVPDAAALEALGEAIRAEGEVLTQVAESALGECRKAGIQTGARC